MKILSIFFIYILFSLTAVAGGYSDYLENPEVKRQMEEIAPQVEKVFKDRRLKEEMERLKPSVKRYKRFMENRTREEAKSKVKKEFKNGRKILQDDEYIYILVSSSVPKDTLKRYVSEAAPFKDFIFAMRGVIGDISKIKPTLKFIEDVIRKDNNTAYDVEFDIDPFIFRESKVKKVPAFVLAKRISDVDKRFKVEAIVYGDLSIGGVVKELYRMTCKKGLEKLADMLHENVGVCGVNEKKNRAGNVYEIAEKDILDEIERRAAGIDKRKIVEILRKKAENWKPQNLADIPPAAENETYTFIPVYTLKRDIPRVDKNGKITGILYPAGYSFNPLKYIHYMPAVVFFNGSRKKEIEWIKRNIKRFKDVRLCTTAGKAYKISEYLGKPVYYATEDMIKKFHVRATISICRKKGDVMEVKVVSVK